MGKTYLKTWNWWKTMPMPEDIALRELTEQAITLGRIPTSEEAWKAGTMSAALHAFSNYDKATAKVAGLLYHSGTMTSPDDLSQERERAKKAGKLLTMAEVSELKKQFWSEYQENVKKVRQTDKLTALLEPKPYRAREKKLDTAGCTIEVLPSGLRHERQESATADEPVTRAKPQTEEIGMTQVQAKATTSNMGGRTAVAQASVEKPKKFTPMYVRALEGLKKLVCHYKAIPSLVQADTYYRYHKAEGAVCSTELVRMLDPRTGWLDLLEQEAGLSGSVN